MQTRFKVWLFRHDPFKRGASIRVLTHFDEKYPNVVHDLNSHPFMGVGHLIQGHSVQLDGFGILTQLEVDVAHVDFETTSIVEHSVFGDDLISIQGFRVHLIGRVLIRQVK